MKPSALAFNGWKKAFLDIVGPRDNDLSGSFSQYVSEEKVRVLLKMPDDNATCRCDAPLRAFLLSDLRSLSSTSLWRAELSRSEAPSSFRPFVPPFGHILKAHA